MASERKLDKELLYDSMVAQALNFYLTRGDMARGLPYRISMDMRGGLRESYEDMVAESVGNVLMHRSDPLVTGLDVRFLDSKYSAGVQAADLFSNVYRTALAQPDSPCRSFLRKYQELGRVHAGFTFGLVELADQMAQIAADLRARVLLEGAVAVLDDGLSATPAQTAEEKIIDVVEEDTGTRRRNPTATEGEAHGVSRSARRRRSRATRRIHAAAQDVAAEQPPSKGAGQTPRDSAESLQAGDVAHSLPEPTTAIVPVSDAVTAGPVETPASAEGTSENGGEPKEAKKPEPPRQKRAPSAGLGARQSRHPKPREPPRSNPSPRRPCPSKSRRGNRHARVRRPRTRAVQARRAPLAGRRAVGRPPKQPHAVSARPRRPRRSSRRRLRAPAPKPLQPRPPRQRAPRQEPSRRPSWQWPPAKRPHRSLPRFLPPRSRAKKATTRRSAPHSRQTGGPLRLGGTSGVDAKAVPPAEGATSSGPSGQEGSPAQAEV